MKRLLLGGVVGAIVVLGFLTYSRVTRSLLRPGFTDADIRNCEQTIRDYYLNQLRNSTSEVEKQEVANGTTTINVHLIKVADRRLEGFVKISVNTQQAREVGLNEITQTCEATMEIDSPQYIWKCH